MELGQMKGAVSSTGTIDQTAIANEVKDGSVLLSIEGDLVCRLNGVGALIWMVLEKRGLEKSGGDLTLAEIVGGLSEQFESINREGQLHYEVAPEQLHRDVERFVRKLVEKGLLQAGANHGIESFRIAHGVIGTTSSITRSMTAPQSRTDNSSADRQAAQQGDRQDRPDREDQVRPFRQEILTALIGLAVFDLLLKLTGFSRLLETIGRWPTKERPTDHGLIGRINASMIRAQSYYPKKVVCLQHAAVMTCLLRRRGIPAEMVIGAQEFPPKAHSWVEVEGRVVNDRPSLKTEYRELRRI